MSKCDNTSVGEIIRDGDRIVVIERANYPQAFALPAGHVDGDAAFVDAAVRESKEEIGITVLKNRLVFREDIDNPCKREGGTHHLWEVYEVVEWRGEPTASSDAKKCHRVTIAELKQMAERTEYFMEKYGIPYDKVGRLTIAIFGNDPALKKTDPEWEEQMGLEPVWYYMLKKIKII